MNNIPKNSEAFSDEELKKAAPVLFGINKENAFVVPDGYFEALNASVMKQVASLPDFESVSNENPFIVPDGYFESLPTGIQQRIIDSKSKRNSVANWIAENISRPVPKYALALASVMLVIVLSAKYFNRTVHVNCDAPQLSESEQLDAAYLQQLDEPVLAEVYAEETSATTETQDEGIENYLLDNDIDLNSITEQF